MTKPVPRIYTTRFFQLVTTRQFAEAERILERVKLKMHISDRNRGYFQALYGMLLTQKNSDRYAFLPSLDMNNQRQLKRYRREFLSQSESRLHDDYDRGFFEAWADYMRILPKLEAVAPVGNNNVNKKPVRAEEGGETQLDERASQDSGEGSEETETEIPTDTEGEKELVEESEEDEAAESRQSAIVDLAE